VGMKDIGNEDEVAMKEKRHHSNSPQPKGAGTAFSVKNKNHGLKTKPKLGVGQCPMLSLGSSGEKGLQLAYCQKPQTADQVRWVCRVCLAP